VLKKLLLSILIIALIFSGCSNTKADNDFSSTLCDSKTSPSKPINSNSPTPSASSSPVLQSNKIDVPYTLKTAKENHDIITFITSNDAKYSCEVYNINYMKDFLNNVRKGKPCKIRVVQFSQYSDKVLLDRLVDLDYNGKFINYTNYNTIPGKNSIYQEDTTIMYGKIEEIKENGLTVVCLKGKLRDQGDNTSLPIIAYDDSQLK